MKKNLTAFLLTAIIFFGCVNIVSATGECELSNEELIGHWKMNAAQYSPPVMNDSSGYGYNAVNYGGAIQAVDRFGNGNASFYFDGINDHFNVSGPFLDLTYSFAVSAWIKTDGQQQVGAGIVTKVDPDASKRTGFVLTVASSRGPGVQLVFAAPYYSSPEHHLYPAVDDGNWHHIVLAYDKKKIHVYLDGAEVNGIEVNYPYGLGSNWPFSLMIGVNPSTAGSKFFKGWIDDVRLYASYLTSCQVQTLYNDESVNFQP